MDKQASGWHQYVLFILVFITEALNCSGFSKVATDPGTVEARYVIGNLSSVDGILNNTDYFPVIDSVNKGAEFAKKECKEQFYWERWNCPDDFTEDSMTSKRNRETAYVQAINAAGIMFDLVRKCQKGKIPGCQCQRSQPVYTMSDQDHSWEKGSCNDQMLYEEKVAEYLTDSIITCTRSDARNAMAFHNSRAGRVNLMRTAKTNCKCIGDSGACTSKTCWMTVSSFRKVGSRLKQKYQRAVHVRYNGFLLIASGKRKGKKAYLDELVYLKSSPDYCKGDTTSGRMGMENRSCSQNIVKRSSTQEIQGMKRGNTQKLSPGEKNSCKRLCEDCGLKVHKRRVAVTTKCCEFHWCCYVTCKDCVKYRVEHYCSKL